MTYRFSGIKIVALLLAFALCGCSGRYEGPAAGTPGEEGLPGQVQQNTESEAGLPDADPSADADPAVRQKEASAGAETDATEQKETFEIQLCGDPETLDPAKNKSTRVMTILVQTRENLMTYDENSRLIPGQAEHVEQSEDGCTYTFHLREGLKWSDGSKLTASDFVYTWRRAADSATDCAFAEELLSNVQGFLEARSGDGERLGVRAPDERTFVVTLEKPDSAFLQICAFPALSPVEEKSEGKTEGDTKKPGTWIGNGPMIVKHWLKDRMILEKNEQYWNQDRVTLQTLIIRFTDDRQAAYELFQKGEVLFAADFPRYLLADPDAVAELEQAPVRKTEYVLFQNNTEALAQKEVRQALALTADTEAVRAVVREYGNLPADRLIGPGFSDGEEREPFYSNTGEAGEPEQEIGIQEQATEQTDRDRAARLLARAGYPNGTGIPELQFVTNASGYDEKLALALQAEWASLGIQVKVTKLDWFNFVPVRETGEFDLTRMGVVADLDSPGQLFSGFTSYQLGNYSNAAFNRCLREAMHGTDRQESYEKFHQAEELLLRDYACIPLSFVQDSWLASKQIDGVRHNPAGWWDFSYARKL